MLIILIHIKKTTCLDRNIISDLNCVRKLLNGEEITGKERIEPLVKLNDIK